MDILLKYFPDLTTQQKEQFAELGTMYRYWNDRINLISRKDVENLYERHILHSLAISRFISFEPGCRVLDIGTGGGFPGVPLAILFPETEFVLVDSIRKKIMAVDFMSRHMNMPNIKAIATRVEKLGGQFDFITARAVARTKVLHTWSKGKLSPVHKHSKKNGYLFLKGGILDEEMKEAKLPGEVIKLSDYFDEPFFQSKRLLYIPVEN